MHAKKSLGQNFLKSKKALSLIVSSAEIKKTDVILEIGPGKGALTRSILESGAKVIAVEKDNLLIPFLESEFEKEIKEKQLTIINKDILEIDFDNKDEILVKNPYKIIANIPYYITGALFKKFLECKNQPEKIVFLIQKEVADRIIVRDGKESILSLSIKAYGKPKYIGKVGKEYFSPKPKVDSAILSISDISKNNFKEVSEQDFFKIIKLGFSHKRKKLSSNLKEGFPEIKDTLDEILEKCGINKDERAENIPINKWLEITKKLNHLTPTK